MADNGRDPFVGAMPTEVVSRDTSVEVAEANGSTSPAAPEALDQSSSNLVGLPPGVMGRPLSAGTANPHHLQVLPDSFVSLETMLP